MRRMIRCELAVLAAVLLCVGAARAEDPYITSLKASFAFSTWPNQGGPLKQGFAFQLSDYPSLLPGYAITSDQLSLDDLSLGLVRNLTLTNSGAVLHVTVGVAVGSTNNAHELYIDSILGARQLNPVAAFMRGDLNGIAVGDLNFVYQGTSASDVQGSISFLRNNMIIVIEDGRPDSPSAVNLYQLATAMDAIIVAMPDLTVSQFAAGQPSIDVYSAVSTTLQAAEGVSVTVNVAISDPTLASGPLSRQFLSNGSLKVVDLGGPTLSVSSGGTLGSVPLELIAINNFLQFSTATITFVVSP